MNGLGRAGAALRSWVQTCFHFAREENRKRQRVSNERQWALPSTRGGFARQPWLASLAQRRCGRHAGHTYVILVTRTKRNAFLRYRMVRPNTIFQPLQTAHFITRNYKKVAQATSCMPTS